MNMSAFVDGGKRNLARKTVQSICSRPCSAGYYYQQKKLACCWECVKCRNNEITVTNITDCQSCPKFKWPDPDTKSRCEPISPYYMMSSEVIGICLVFLDILGVFTSTGTIIIYIAKKKNKLIKATSKELSIIILIGCMLACFAGLLFLTNPNRWSCVSRQAGFRLVVCIMYAPLLAKTSRVYRIFSAGKRGSGRPKFISSQAQLIFTFMCILIQVREE